MADRERLSDLIGDIYDTTIDRALWPSVLERIADFVEGVGAGIFSRDAVERTGNLHYGVGTEQRFIDLYFDRYIKLDPLSEAYLLLNDGDVFSSSEYMPLAEFAETRFYQEWVKPQGFIDNVTAVLHKSASRQATAVVFRHERNGLADDAARQRMRLLVPHLRRAVLIGNVVDIKSEAAATFADALDGLAASIFLVDASGRIAHANAAGEALLSAGDMLHRAGTRIAAHDAEADRALRDVFANARHGDAAVGTGGVALPLARPDGQRYVAHVLPLTSGSRRRAGAPHAAVAALFVQKASLPLPSNSAALAKAFRLTPTELRVLLAIVAVGGVPEVAETLGIAETTVRTHLGRIFEKTGVARQADLVRLVGGFSAPFVD